MSYSDSGPSLLSRHTHVVVGLASDPHVRMRDLADWFGVPVPAIQSFVRDLEDGGLLKRSRQGGRNVYSLQLDRPLGPPLDDSHSIRQLIELPGSGPEASGNEVGS